MSDTEIHEIDLVLQVNRKDGTKDQVNFGSLIKLSEGDEVAINLVEAPSVAIKLNIDIKEDE